MAKKKLGNQTPTRSIKQAYRKSDADEAVKIYEQSCRKVMEWQRNLLKPILAINKDGLWTHTKCGYSVPRRNGKNEILVIREMYGLLKGERINHTAHRTTTSHAAWERLCAVLDAAGIEYESLRATGRERVEIEETGGRVEFRTRTTTGGLGEGFDLLVIDEAQEYTADQETTLKYVVTDSKRPQTIMCGTPPTPLSSGTVFTGFRKKALSGTTKNAFWAEWSVSDMTDPHDVKAWYQSNPSLGTIFTERDIEDEIGEDEVDFNIQRLGHWISYNQKSAITKQEWERLQVKALPSLKGKLFVGIKYSRDGMYVAMAIAVKTLSGRVFVEVIDCQSVRNGNDWILAFLHNTNISMVLIDGAGKQDILANEIKAERLAQPVLPTVKEVIVANSMWEQAIFKKTLCHMGQPSLVQVASNCEKRPIGTGGGFGYKSQYDDMEISLMDACILAHWACREAKEKKKQRIYY